MSSGGCVGLYVFRTRFYGVYFKVVVNRSDGSIYVEYSISFKNFGLRHGFDVDGDSDSSLINRFVGIWNRFIDFLGSGGYGVIDDVSGYVVSYYGGEGDRGLYWGGVMDVVCRFISFVEGGGLGVGGGCDVVSGVSGDMCSFVIHSRLGGDDGGGGRDVGRCVELLYGFVLGLVNEFSGDVGVNFDLAFSFGVVFGGGFIDLANRLYRLGLGGEYSLVIGLYDSVDLFGDYYFSLVGDTFSMRGCGGSFLVDFGRLVSYLDSFFGGVSGVLYRGSYGGRYSDGECSDCRMVVYVLDGFDGGGFSVVGRHWGLVDGVIDSFDVDSFFVLLRELKGYMGGSWFVRFVLGLLYLIIVSRYGVKV